VLHYRADCEKNISIKNSGESKGYSARRLMQEFPDKNLKRGGIENLLRKSQETGSLEKNCLMGSGRTCTMQSCVVQTGAVGD